MFMKSRAHPLDIVGNWADPLRVASALGSILFDICILGGWGGNYDICDKIKYLFGKGFVAVSVSEHLQTGQTHPLGNAALSSGTPSIT